MNLTPTVPPNPSSLEDLAAAAVLLDTQRVVWRVNQPVARWYGVAPEARLDRPLADISRPTELRTGLPRLLTPGTAGAHEALMAATAQRVSFSAARQPYDGWVLYGQDITLQKQREQQYQALADTTPGPTRQPGRLPPNTTPCSKRRTSCFACLKCCLTRPASGPLITATWK